MAATSDSLRIVPTPHHDRLEILSPTLIDRAEILVLDGDHGTGKTTATTAWASGLTVPVHVLDLAPKLTCQQLVRHLHHAVHSNVDKEDLPEREYQDDLVDTLASPRVVVIRNIHRLTSETAAQIEWLYSQRANAAAFVLEGGPGTGKAVARDAMLRGRVAYTITAQRLDADQAADVVRNLHPVLATADATLLRKISTDICAGLLSHWARFLRTVLDIRDEVVATGRPAPPLSPDIAKLARTRMPSTMRGGK